MTAQLDLFAIGLRRFSDTPRWPSRRPLPELLCRRRQIVLAIDPAHRSGWSVWNAGRFVSAGACGVVNAGPVVTLAVELGRGTDQRLVVVAERPYSRGFTAQSLAASWGGWALLLEQAGHDMRLVVRVNPATWMARVLGKGAFDGYGANKRAAMVRAREVLGKIPDNDDIADSICIGLWATGGLWATQGATR